MATKTDFTEAEWTALQRGLTGSAMLVSLADRDFTDTFGEVGAMTKFLQGQQVAAPSELIREVAKTHSTGFGVTTSPQNLRTETMAALQAAIAALEAKAPAELDAYRQTVLGVAQAVAEAKGGVTPVETGMLDEIRKAVGGS
jgi:tellurite resistance protein